MKMVVFGATGGTGAMVVQQALAAGHEVTAATRDPGRVALRHEHLRIVQGDVLDFASTESAIRGQDAVISCIGGTTGGKPVMLYSAGMANILRAMRGRGVRRLVCVSANPLEVGNGDVLLDRLILKRIVRAIFRASYADLARMEAEVRASGLDWTIMRPPRLTNRPATAHYRIAYGRNLPRGRSIGRAVLAAAMLRLLGDPKALHAWVTVAN